VDLTVRLTLFAAGDLTTKRPNVAYTAGQGGTETILLATSHSVQDYRRDFPPFVFG
jgi:uncharacterized membrane protein YhfC